MHDDAAQAVQLKQPARRIVSLAPHATEMLFAAGAGSQVVGVSEFSDWPPAATTLPSVGSYAALDLERIVAMKPDLVVGWVSGNPPRQLQQLRELGISVFASEPRRLDDIPSNLQRLGQLSGNEAAANKAAAEFRRRIAAVRERYRGAAPIRVFYQIWSSPLMTLNGEHMVSDVLRLCGGVNVFAAQLAIAPTVNEEAVLAARPELIVSPSEPGVAPGSLERWKRWKTVPAVARGNLIGVDGNLLNRSGPRIAEGAEMLCGALELARARH